MTNLKEHFLYRGTPRLLPAAFLAQILVVVAAFGAVDGAKVLRFSLPSEPPQLDSTKTTDTQSAFVLGHIMEGLTRYGQKGKILPGVAENWELNDKTAIFHLRHNALWSDGKPVTAKDFIFAWRTALDPKTASEYAFIMYPLKNAEAINSGKMPVTALGATASDDFTIKISFEKPCGYFLGLSAFQTYLPIRQDFYEAQKGKYAANSANLLFNGPFSLTSWVHGASLEFDKNSNYWNKSKIALDKIEIPYITADNNARFNFFKDRKIDVLETLTKDDLDKAYAEKFKMQSYSSGAISYLEFNFRQGHVTGNKNLRKAIQLVFNPLEYVGKVVGIPGTLPGKSLIPSWVPGTSQPFRKEYKLDVPKANLTEAKKYLAAAEKELGGKIPPLVWLTRDSPQQAKEAEYFQNLLKNTLGIDLRIDKQIFKQQLAKMTSGEFDIVSANWSPDFADPMTFAELMASWNENNRGKYASADYDKHIKEAQGTANQKSRMDAMAAAEKIALDDLPILPLAERSTVYLSDDRVSGVIRNVVGPDPDFTMAKVVK